MIKVKENKLIITIIALSLTGWLWYFLGKLGIFTYIFQEVSLLIVTGVSVLVIIISIYATNLLIKKIKIKEKVSKSIHKIILVILLILFQISAYTYVLNFWTTGGSYNILDKGKIGDEYYIYLENDFENNHYVVKLRCDYDEFSRVIVDKDVLYTITFEWNSISPEKGNIIQLQVDDFIDNREIMEK